MNNQLVNEIKTNGKPGKGKVIPINDYQTKWECKTVYKAPSRICEDCEGTLDHVGTYNNNKDIWLICLDCKREYSYNPITQKWSYLF